MYPTLCVNLVRACGGEITCEDRGEGGTRFTVYLPEYEELLPGEAQFPDTTPMTAGQGNILFVDDEPEITTIVKKMFENLGYTVSTACSGKEALDVFSGDPERFDLMITDMGMPGMTGEQLVKAVARIRPSLPLILCTGYSEIIDEAAARHTGVAEYISKPYSLRDLAAMAAKYT